MSNDYQAIFKRQENKYILSRSQYEELIEAMDPYMQRDSYGLHTISSIYFDTEDFKTIRPSLGKKVFKEKLRLRSYGTPGKSDKVFLEFKKKFKGITYKRRITMTHGEAMDYLMKGKHPDDNSQIFHEIDWFVKQYNPQAKALIAYDRIATFGKEDNELRITFDFNARYRINNLDLSMGAYGLPLTDDDIVLMEIKTIAALPCWLTEMLTERSIFPTSFSKYRTVYENHLVNKEDLRYVG